MKKGIYVLISLVVLFFGDMSAEAIGPSGELRIGVPSLYNETFYPLRHTFYRKLYLNPMYDFIIGSSADGKFDPTQSIAYKWEQSSDSLSWTFWIRDGVKFHNGDPLTNEDVAFTIRRLTTFNEPFMARADFVANIDRVETVPPNKVVVRLKKTLPLFLHLLSNLYATNGMVQPKKYIEEKGLEYFMAHPIGSGPYKLKEWKEHVYIKLEAQDSHWRIKVPKYRYLTLMLMPEGGTRVAALKSGEVDIIKIGIAAMEDLKSKGFSIRSRKEGILVSLSKLYTDDASPTEKPEVRQALFLAIDRKAILDQILFGQGRLEGAPLCMFPWSPEYKPYPPVPYDPELAKKLLVKAGYPDGFTIYLYSYTTSLPETKIINEAIAGYWEAIGLKVKILELVYSAFLPLWEKQKAPPGPAFFVHSFTTKVIESYRYNYDFFSSSAAMTKDRELTNLILELEKQTSIEGYIAAARRCTDRIIEQHLINTICYTDDVWAVIKEVPVWEFGKSAGDFRWEYVGQ